jgi:uncharacterized repeat protein (TIGR01451 family)
MNNIKHNTCRSSSFRVTWMALAAAVSLAAGNARAFTADLQAQSFGNTNWTTGHIFGWAELDPIPTRVTLAGGPTSNRTVTINFPHDGIQNLFSFAPSANVVITSGPTLSAPSSGNWSYSFTVSLTDSNPGFVEFRMRLAAGSHNFPGSSLQVDGSPNLTKLFVFKSAALPGAPDLAIVKSGPASANPGSIIAYSVSYSNRINASAATGVQIVDTLPDSVSFVDASNGGQSLGNQIIWDLGDIARGSHGKLTYHVAVTNVVTTGFSFQNNAVIAEAENDANYADNSSSVTTVVTGNCIPASIIADPSDAAICLGDTTTFSVAANGSAPLSYQWRKDGVDIVGANSDTIITGEDGAYDVVVSNLCGSQTSTVAHLMVDEVIVTSHPENFVACESESAAFNVIASGDGLTYQWRKDGTDIAGATNALLEIASVTGADVGGYDVMIAGTCGSTTSDVATLTLNPTVSITGNPTDAIVCTGDMPQLSVIGDNILSYQWRKDGMEIAGATSSSYFTTEAGSYDVIVAGSCNSSATSTVATVTLLDAPAITQGPVSATVCPGAPVTLTVLATGASLNYQWRWNGSDILGANDSSFSFAAVAGSYDVVVTGACGSPMASDPAVITLKSAPAVIDDVYDAAMNITLNVGAPGVLANDTDSEGDTLTASLVSTTSHGTLGLNADGSFSYAPDLNYSGPDSFLYSAVNICGDPTTASVTINVAPGNLPPIAVNDSITIDEDSGAQVIDVLANDSDPNGDTLTITGVSQGANGGVAMVGNTVSYTPSANFSGSDSFTYTISDGYGESASATVSVTVTAINDAPVAADDSYQMGEDDTLIVAAPGVLANDHDAEGATLTAALVSSPAHGSVTLNADGSFTYLPADNYNGADSFTYKVSDGSLDSNVATVNITVQSVLGAGDIDLYVKSGKARVNWATANGDTLILRGQINPRGIKDNLTGATVALEINGVQVLAPQTLDAKGKSAKAQLKNTNGRYSVKLTGADLRSVIGLVNATGTGLHDVTVRLTINGANLDVPVTTAQLECPFKTTANKSSQLKFNFRKNRTITGAFNANKSTGSKSSKGESVTIKGVVTAEDGGSITPNDAITIRVGNDTITLPMAALSNKSGVWQYAGSVAKLSKFTLSNKARSFTLGVVSSSIGLPATGSGTGMKYSLPLQIQVPTADGLMTFESIIELKRTSETATHWKR